MMFAYGRMSLNLWTEWAVELQTLTIHSTVMASQYEIELSIENPLGFHVRPVQRFAELAQLFKADIEVEIGGRSASGKSVMGLMSLGGRYGSNIKIKTKGEDARQALNILSYVIKENFFVEDGECVENRPDRHIERLANFASAFESDIKLISNGKEIDAKDQKALSEEKFDPTSDVSFEVKGPDAEQAGTVLNKLKKYSFYLEDHMGSVLK